MQVEVKGGRENYPFKSTKRSALKITSKATWATIMKSLEENASASIALRVTPSIKNVILSTNHVGPWKLTREYYFTQNIVKQ